MRERVIYVVVDVDEVPVRAFIDLVAAESFVASSEEPLHVVPVTLSRN